VCTRGGTVNLATDARRLGSAYHEAMSVPLEDISAEGWAIVDADGATAADHLPDRAEAVRRLGLYVCADRPLPLRVLSPTGDWSGDSIG
jgi:hypothetical protein